MKYGIQCKAIFYGSMMMNKTFFNKVDCVMLDMSKGRLVMDDQGNVIGNEPVN